ncbi:MULTISPECIES: hypothetical protein [Pseudomonas]|uniref:hypothetical protein n=1 Tax=unclassified Pseudomonas TaxID=196821 RepID=UPI000C259FC9|nr:MULTISPECIES: hypothetical protein [unclassified Pseudomonas]MBT1260142.1 hypothetical protein [Pseudomonas sp. VS40]MBT1272016.1 hypothetical protein [Pseudomonas sp. VS59]PJK32681.1 hypothetical protein CWC49_04980 [Pseudomonas sp. S09F 262]PJK42171.1 hypothetical protein CWC48_24530 [Pseudomonas sp. S10E 269]
MPCETCQRLGESVTWLDFGIKITRLPVIPLCPKEQDLYRFFVESHLVWKVDHLDAYGQFWLCVQYDEQRYELLAPLPGTYEKILCDPPYPVPRH